MTWTTWTTWMTCMTQMRTRMTGARSAPLVLALLAAFTPAADARAQESVPPPPPTQAPPAGDAPVRLYTPVEVVPVSNDPAIKNADDLLDALETADRDLRTLQAGLSWVKVFEIQGDQQTRLGSLYFRSVPSGKQQDEAGSGGPEFSRAFEIRFTDLLIGSRIEKRSESYVFDGEWLIEKQPEQKLMIKRQVAPPGETFDPLRVGEGQLPIPIGQKKKDILDRFNAELVPLNDLISDDEHAKDLEEFVKGSVQVRLTPRDELKDSSEFQEIRLWYRRAEELKDKPYLPRMARAVNRQSDVSLVQLINMKINEPLPGDVLDTSAPEGWQVQVRPYRQGE